MRISSTRTDAERGRDAYFSPIEAVRPLIALENLPPVIYEPCAGDGAIVRPMEASGRKVVARDIADYGAGFQLADYLTSDLPQGLIEGPQFGIVTNPPYRLAEEFARKALAESNYVALLLRLNWLEGGKRLRFFRKFPPHRVLVSSRRLPMMHQYGWTGPKAPSNTCYSWFIWDGGRADATNIHWFDWRDYE